MFDPESYGPSFADLLALQRVESLGPGVPTPAARTLLKTMTLDQAFQHHGSFDHDMGRACFAGIWLYHNYLDESHQISQSLGTGTGSFWHGIMHRREPDAWNSRYWFDRVGSHPVFVNLRDEARRLAECFDLPAEATFLRDQPAWNPHRFVELCESARLQRVDAESLCLQIQAVEWQLLFDHCYRRAVL